MSGLQRALKIIACLWLIAFFSALPFAMCTKINYMHYEKTNVIIEVNMLYLFEILTFGYIISL